MKGGKAVPKISVIIPVYNVEKYLNRCVDSVLNQSYRDFEIILINDGSSDLSGQICDEYAHKDNRIKVVHKKNARVSAARNDGLKLARGKYISFIDSDDWIETEMFRDMVQKAEERDVDFIMCDYNKRSEGYEEGRTHPIRDGYYSKDDIKKELFQCLIMFEHIEFPPTISNWVCIFKKEFLLKHNLSYDEDIHYCEDSILGSKIMYHANSFYYLKGRYYYNYFNNPSSTTNTYNANKWTTYLKINERLEKYFINDAEYDFERQIKINMLYFTLNTLGQIKYSGYSRIKRKKMVEKVMFNPKVQEIFKDFKIPKVSWKTKISILLVKYKLVRLYSLIFLNDDHSKKLNFSMN